MDGILDDLLSLRWWFSAFVVALLVNILAVYIPKWFGRFVKVWGERNERIKEKRAINIAYLTAHPEQLAEEWGLINYLAILSIGALTLALVIMVFVAVILGSSDKLGRSEFAITIGVAFFLVMGIISFMIGLQGLIRGAGIRSAVREARVSLMDQEIEGHRRKRTESEENTKEG